MKIRILLVTALVFLFVAGFAATAQAQSYCDSVVFSTSSATAGSKVDFSGDAPFGTMNVLWDGTQIATFDVDGTFSEQFTVPADATPGSHEVTIEFVSEGTIECPVTFTVEGETVAPSVPSTVYPVANITSLPSTGFFLLIPAAGLALGGIGAAGLRRRRG